MRRTFLTLAASWALLAGLSASPAMAKPDNGTVRDSQRSPVHFWDRIDQPSCFGLSRAWYTEYLKSIGLNYGDSWTVGTPDAHELNQQWVEMWCEGDPAFNE